MKDLTNGKIPKELQKKYKNGVNVALNDLREKDFPKPIEKKSYFSGEGVTLGQPTSQ